MKMIFYASVVVAVLGVLAAVVYWFKHSRESKDEWQDLPRFDPKLVLIVAFAFAALVGATWLARPTYSGWKQRRALVRAQLFLAKEDYRNAALSARQVLQLNPGHLDATRIMAEVSERLRAPEAGIWRRRLVELNPSDATNRLRLAEMALSQGNVPLALECVNAITNGARRTVAYQEVAAMLAMSSNNFAQAERHYREAMEISPTNRTGRLNLAVVQLQSAEPGVAEAARRTIEQLAEEPGLRRNALNNLVALAIRRGETNQIIAYSRRLAAAPEATFDDRLRYLSLLKELNQAEFTPALATTEKSAAADPRLVHSLTAWLLNNRLSDEAERWLGALPENVKTNEPVLMARTDCSLARSNWAAVVELAKDASWAERDYLRRAMLARAYRELRQPAATESEWRGAVADAGTEVGAVNALVRATAAWGWRQEQEDLLWSIVQRLPRERWALELLRQQYAARHDTRGLHRVYSTIHAYNPQDLAAKNNVAALGLLLNQQRSQATQAAAELYQASPTNSIYASTHAWALHLDGKTAEAIRVMETLDARALEDPALALYYGAMLATNNPTKARLFLDIASKGRFLPEEKAILDAAVRALP